jgi:hypothetical protein
MIDGELYLETEKSEISKLEPFGSFGLTEWIKYNSINYTEFPQQGLLDNNGVYGNHEQKLSWRSK